jgi:hypothetical protein
MLKSHNIEGSRNEMDAGGAACLWAGLLCLHQKCQVELRRSGGAKPDGLFKEEFKLEFIADDVTGKAVMVDNAGMTDVDLHAGSYGVTFMEKLGTGAVQMTTIASSGARVRSRARAEMGLAVQGER